MEQQRMQQQQSPRREKFLLILLLLSIFHCFADYFRLRRNYCFTNSTNTNTTNGVDLRTMQELVNYTGDEEAAATERTATATATTSTSMAMEVGNHNTENNNNNTKIPRTIYMFWDSGWPANRVDPNLCRRSWEAHNPDFTVRALDTAQAEALTNRSRYVPDKIWDQMAIQGKSDVYRTLLLFLHGGIWADASVFCNQPIEDWLNLDDKNNTAATSDLLSFRRFDNPSSQRRRGIKPWITSWFLASPPKSYTLSRIVDVISNKTGEQQQRLLRKGDYFWWHRLVSDLARGDPYVSARISEQFRSNVQLMCPLNTKKRKKEERWTSVAPMVKRCANPSFVGLFATAQHCCLNNAEQQQQQQREQSNNKVRTYPRAAEMVTKTLLLSQNNNATANNNNKATTMLQLQDICATWNCTMPSANMHHLRQLKTEVYGPENWKKLGSLFYSERAEELWAKGTPGK